MIVARAELQPHRIQRDLLEDEERVSFRFHRRQERLVAKRGKICALRLITDAAFKQTELLVQHLQPAIVAFHIENGADFRSFKLRVRVVGEAPLVVDRLDRCERLVKRAAQIPAALLQTDGHVGLGDGAVI